MRRAQVVDEGVPYFHICVTGGMGSLAPESIITRGIASISRAVERGSDRFQALMRTRDERLAAEWIAVLRSVCGRQRSQGIDRLQHAIAAGEVQVAIQMAEDLASLSAAVPKSSGRLSSPRADWAHPMERARSPAPSMQLEPASSAAAASAASPATPENGSDPLGGAGRTTFERSLLLSGRSSSGRSLEGSRLVDVGAARPYRAPVMSSDDNASADEAVHEVSVVLHPVGASSEKRRLREELVRARKMLGVQRSALQQAHAALSSVRGSSTSVDAAATAVADALRDTTCVDSPQFHATEGVVALAEMAPAAPLPVASLSAAAGGGGEARAQAARAQAARAEEEEEEAGKTKAEEVAAAAEAAEEAKAAEAAKAAEEAAEVDEEAEEERRTGKPRAGFTVEQALMDGTLQLTNGNGTEFELRLKGYNTHKKKGASPLHVYEPVRVDVFKRKSVMFHVASRLTLPPPPDGKATSNRSGLPRRLIFNTVLPAEGPSLMGGSDGLCFQTVIVFEATAERLEKWVDEGSEAARLFQRFCRDAPEGVMPSSGDTDIKERLKLVPMVDNIKTIGISMIEKYNGKPALLTKSGSVHRGDDYIELGLNTFRFGYTTKKAVSMMFHRIKDLDFHAAVTLEGRSDDELSEQALLAVRLKGLDLPKLASEVWFSDPE